MCKASIYVLCTWKLQTVCSCAKLAYMYFAHGYYKQYVYVQSQHIRTLYIELANSMFMCKSSMYVLCTQNLQTVCSCANLPYTYFVHGNYKKDDHVQSQHIRTLYIELTNSMLMCKSSIYVLCTQNLKTVCSYANLSCTYFVHRTCKQYVHVQDQPLNKSYKIELPIFILKFYRKH